MEPSVHEPEMKHWEPPLIKSATKKPRKPRQSKKAVQLEIVDEV
jgi:hypothetical protein